MDPELRAQYMQLRAAIKAENYDLASKQLTVLKLTLLRLNALVPSSSLSPILLQATREILELGALTSIHQRDSIAFQRYWHQLQAFYELPESDDLPTSDDQPKLTGLYLLLLLSTNQNSTFHTILETLTPEDVESDEFIKYPVTLERWLNEGSYDKVWAATKPGAEVPSEEFRVFTDVLVFTIRSEIALCSEKAYNSLPVANAKSLLFLESDKQVIDFAANRGWIIQADGRIYFPEVDEEASTKGVAFGGGAPQTQTQPSAALSERVIENTIGYARELETIV